MRGRKPILKEYEGGLQSERGKEGRARRGEARRGAARRVGVLAGVVDRSISIVQLIWAIPLGPPSA